MAAQRKYPEELRERAVKMLFEVREREGKGHGELARVARQLDVHPEALRSWVQQAEIDGGQRPGTTSGDKQRITELEREVRELRRANEILKAASAYFARELDPRLRSPAVRLPYVADVRFLSGHLSAKLFDYW